MNQPNRSSCSKKAAPVLLIIGICFVGANLRAPLTSIGPLIRLILDDLHISDALAGMITTLPLFAFALFSPLAPKIARRFGTEWVLFCSIITLTIGILLRSMAGGVGLFVGTAILGVSISAGNVLTPSLIKKEFPEKIGVMTGIYSVAMNVFGALASGISIPLAAGLGLGWAGALRLWAILSLISIVIWIPQLKRQKQRTSPANKISDVDVTADICMSGGAAQEPVSEKVIVWKSALAWQVTIYAGLQTMVFFCMVAWMPYILIQRGMSQGQSGWMLSLMQLALIPMTFASSVLAVRTASQRLLMTIGSGCVIVGLLGLLIFGGTFLTFLWVILLGIGGGFTFSLSILFFSLRTNNADEAARLSGMAQSIGGILAALGPILLGFLHDTAGNWTTPLMVLIVFAVICFFAGLGAARDSFIAR